MKPVVPTPNRPPVGTRKVCKRCGRTVWLRSTGTMGWSASVAPGSPMFEWCARKGTKPRPIQCPVSDGFPFTHHEVEGFEDRYYDAPA